MPTSGPNTNPESPLETLLVVQDHDTAADRLRHRRSALGERAELEAAVAKLAEVDAGIADLVARRADVDGKERRLGDDVALIAGKATAVERTMYSGEVSSPRELQAMQADVEQLRRQQKLLEDRELDLMERREQLDAAMVALEAEHAVGAAEADRLRAVISEQEAAIDSELATELEARASAATLVPATVVAVYEQRRAESGIGAARLVGMSCQACHLTVPSTEVDRMRREAHAGTATSSSTGALAFCDNCGAILVLQ